MDIRLRNAIRKYRADPTYEKLFVVVRLRVLLGESPDVIGRELGRMATQMALAILREQCRHPGLEYRQDSRRGWDPETGHYSRRYHWWECPECGHTEGHGEGWRTLRRNPELDPEEVEYLGIFLTPQSKEKLKQVIPATFKQKSGDHITIVHSPDEDQLVKFEKYIGKKIVLTATHVVENDRVQAIRIKDVQTERGTPHITISWADAASPVEANELVATEKGVPIQPWLKLEGIFDVYPRSVETNPYRRNADAGLRQLRRGWAVGIVPAGKYIAALERAVGQSPEDEDSDLEIEKTLILSTGHLTQTDAELIPQWQNDWVIHPHGEYGWNIWLPSLEERWQAAMQLFTINIFNLMVFAFSHGCQWLRFDQDGPVVDELDTFDW